MIQRTLNTLHLFENYLLNAQNWVFRTLTNLPECTISVAAYNYENSNFVTPPIKLIDLPNYVSLDLLEGQPVNDKSHLQRFTDELINKRETINNKFFKYLVRKTKELKTDIIHCHFAHMGYQFLELKKLTGLPFVVSFYGFDYESLPHKYPKWKERYTELFNTADAFICEGAFGAAIIQSQGCPAEKIKVVPLGVDTDTIPLSKRTKKVNELRLLQLANFRQKKGHIYSIMAFADAVHDCQNMTMTFLGHEVQSGLSSWVEEYKISDKVNLIDSIPFEELYEYMKSFQVFIHPSCYADDRDCEGGAPIVILDAECTGMPVIATTHCDIPSEVIDGKTGLLTPEKNVEQLAASIRHFYRMNNEQYQKYAVEARNHVIKKFNIRKTASQLVKAYREILSSG